MSFKCAVALVFDKTRDEKAPEALACSRMSLSTATLVQG